MRENELRRFANRHLTADKRGAYRDKRHRLFVINKVIHDLFKLRCAPATWYGLNQTHIQALVTLWKKQNIMPVTLMKYMTFLRYFLRMIDHPINRIDNQTLGLCRMAAPVYRVPLSEGIIGKIPHPIAQTIFRLQTGFGLTFSESTQLIPDVHIREHSIWLTREVASNSHDRTIPVHDETQLTILQSLRELTGNTGSLISVHGYQGILYIYRTSMRQAGLLSTKSYRYQYAKHQFKFLSQTFERGEIMQIIMREMGLKSRTTLWGYLHE